MIVPLVFHVLEQASLQTTMRPSSVSYAEAARIINRSENFGLWTLDLDSGHLHWSDRTFEIFGIEKKANPVNFKEHSAQYHPEDLAISLELLEMASKNKTGYQLVLRIKDGAGGYKLIRVVAKYKLDRDNKPVLYGMVHHIGPIEFLHTALNGQAH